MPLQADSVQCVIFVAPGQQQGDAIKLWELLFPGNSPDGFQRATDSPALESSASGEREGFGVVIATRVGRIDIILQQPPGMLRPGAPPPRIANVEDACRMAVGYLRRICSHVRAVRISLVLDTSQTVQIGDEGRILLESLEGFPIPPEATDISLQFNLRKPFEFDPEYKMNRMCTWSTGQINFMVAPPIGQPNGQVHLSRFAGVKFDINSAPEMVIPPEHIDAASEELLMEAFALHNEGVRRLIS